MVSPDKLIKSGRIVLVKTKKLDSSKVKSYHKLDHFKKALIPQVPILPMRPVS
jgi:hypothetical protein